MPRRPRLEYEGAIYHVTVRMVGAAWETGREKRPEACLFRDRAEREHFLRQLGLRVEAYGIRLYAYCLMLSHFHLHLETPRANLGRFMHSLNTAFTVYSNLRRNRRGPLVTRYKAKPVEGDGYHLTLSRYLHLNPVCVSAVARVSAEERLQRLQAYPWSSYRAYIGKQKAEPWLNLGPVLSMCGSSPSGQRKAYARFVESALADDDEHDLDWKRESEIAIGGETFCDWVRDQIAGGLSDCAHPEDVSFRQERVVLSAETVLGKCADLLGVETAVFRERRRNSHFRGVAARMLCRYAGLTQRAAANVLGVGTGAAIGAQMRKLDAHIGTDRKLRRLVAELDAMFADMGAGRS